MGEKQKRVNHAFQSFPKAFSRLFQNPVASWEEKAATLLKWKWLTHPGNKVECRHDCKCPPLLSSPLPIFFPVAQEMNCRRRRHETFCDDEGRKGERFLPNATLSHPHVTSAQRIKHWKETIIACLFPRKGMV